MKQQLSITIIFRLYSVITGSTKKSIENVTYRFSVLPVIITEHGLSLRAINSTNDTIVLSIHNSVLWMHKSDLGLFYLFLCQISCFFISVLQILRGQHGFAATRSRASLGLWRSSQWCLCAASLLHCYKTQSRVLQVCDTQFCFFCLSHYISAR